MNQVLYIGWGENHFRFEGDVDGYLKDHQPFGRESDEYRGYAGTLQPLTEEGPVPYYVRGFEVSSKEELTAFLEAEFRRGEYVTEETYQMFHLFRSEDPDTCVIVPNSTYWNWQIRGLLRSVQWRIEDENFLLQKLKGMFPSLDWGYSVKESLYRGVYERWVVELQGGDPGWKVSLFLQPEKAPLVLAHRRDADLSKLFKEFGETLERLRNIGASITPMVSPKRWEYSSCEEEEWS